MLDPYIRQKILPEIGEEGQKKLGEKTVLIAGCGALGTNTAEALLRAGVKHLVLVDRDVVEVHNLHRVSLFLPEDLGRPKALAAKERLQEIDPEAQIDCYVAHLDPKLAEELVPKVDLVADGLDNLETRYVLNDTCVKYGKPWIYTAVLATYGLIMPIVPEKGPCLRCLFPNPPRPGAIPTCAEAGILGTVPKVLASLQATAALAILLESPDAKPGELFYFDVWRRRTQTVQVQRAKDCPTCVGKDFQFLRESSRTATLCGDSVQILPRERARLDLPSLAQRLSRVGKAEVKSGVLFAELEGLSFTVFPDGRAIIKGVSDPNRAQALYDQFIAR